MDINIKPIAYIHNDFTEKFGIPRQSGIVNEAESLIVFEEDYQNESAFLGIEEFSHLWIIWNFSENNKAKNKSTVRPPRLGGNKRMGVFATRSPFRPNALGLSSVEFVELLKMPDKKIALKVRGADLMNMTPILDVKPYLKYTDCHIDATGGFTDNITDKKLKVIYKEETTCALPKEKIDILTKILENDPRPSYHSDERTYTFSYSDFEISFFVKDGILIVTDIKK